MNKNEFVKLIKDNFPFVDNNVFELIEKYKDFLRQQNKLYNLTRLDSEDKIYLEYFYRSIIPYKNIIKNKDLTLLDIGSGSGIPGILIKIICPKINLSIVESNTKKVIFMKELVDILGLSNVNFINGRAEELDKKYLGYFDIVTSRAVASLNILFEISFPYLKTNGLFIAPKSSNYQEELYNSKWIIEQLKIKDLSINKVDIDQFDDYVIVSKKVNEIDDKIFPRKWKDIIT